MITKIEIDGFKAFSNFQMEFAPLTVIAGTNASGKSNLFDAMKLISGLVESDLKTAFSDLRGDALELFTLYNENEIAHTITLAVELLLHKVIKDKFGGEANLKYTRLRYELTIRRELSLRGIQDLVVVHEALMPIRHDEDKWVKLFIPKAHLENWRPKVTAGKRGIPYIETSDRSIILRQDGKGGNKKEFPLNNISQAIISTANSVDFPHVLAAKEEIKNWHFLQLNPEDLRKPSSYLANDELSHTGENLAAVMHRIKTEDPYLINDIARRLNALLPGITNFCVVDDEVTKQFVLQIKTLDGRDFTSRVLSEGTLRLLTLCVFLYDPQHNGLLCFEEPENGVHPARMKLTAEILMDLVTNFEDPTTPLQRQVIVNTHSPALISEIFGLLHSNAYTVWLSEMVMKVLTIEGKKRKLRITKMSPVFKNNAQFTFEFPDSERKITMHSVNEYLNHSDYEVENVTEL